MAESSDPIHAYRKISVGGPQEDKHCDDATAVDTAQSVTHQTQTESSMPPLEPEATTDGRAPFVEVPMIAGDKDQRASNGTEATSGKGGDGKTSLSHGVHPLLVTEGARKRKGCLIEAADSQRRNLGPKDGVIDILSPRSLRPTTGLPEAIPRPVEPTAKHQKVRGTTNVPEKEKEEEATPDSISSDCNSVSSLARMDPFREIAEDDVPSRRSRREVDGAVVDHDPSKNLASPSNVRPVREKLPLASPVGVPLHETNKELEDDGEIGGRHGRPAVTAKMPNSNTVRQHPQGTHRNAPAALPPRQDSNTVEAAMRDIPHLWTRPATRRSVGAVEMTATAGKEWLEHWRSTMGQPHYISIENFEKAMLASNFWRLESDIFLVCYVHQRTGSWTFEKDEKNEFDPKHSRGRGGYGSGKGGRGRGKRSHQS